MNDMNNEKNKSAVILSPEAGVGILGASVESVINDRAKTKRYSAKRDLYGDFAYAQPIKITLILFLVAILSCGTLSESLATTISCINGVREDGVTTCEKCGDNCNWKIENGKLTVSGSGAMYDYSKRTGAYWGTVEKNTPWQNETFNSVSIEKGITSVGAGSFRDIALNNCTIADSVQSIGIVAFHRTTIDNLSLPPSLTKLEHGAFHRASVDNLILESVEIIEQGSLSHTYDGIKNIVIENPNVTFENNDAISATNAVKYCLAPQSGSSPCAGKGNVVLYTKDSNGVYKIGDKYYASPDDMLANNVCGSGSSASDECITAALAYQDQKAENMAGGALCATKEGCMDLINMANKKDVCSSIADCHNYAKNCFKQGNFIYNNECVAEYPFVKKRWTPAEANEWLHDGNDNFVIITFKK